MKEVAVEAEPGNPRTASELKRKLAATREIAP